MTVKTSRAMVADDSTRPGMSGAAASRSFDAGTTSATRIAAPAATGAMAKHCWPGGGIDVPDDAVQHQPAAPPARLRAVADQLSAIALEHHRGQARVASAFHGLDQQAFPAGGQAWRSEEHTSELQSPDHLLCPLLPA